METPSPHSTAPGHRQPDLKPCDSEGAWDLHLPRSSHHPALQVNALVPHPRKIHTWCLVPSLGSAILLTAEGLIHQMPPTCQVPCWAFITEPSETQRDGMWDFQGGAGQRTPRRQPSRWSSAQQVQPPSFPLHAELLNGRASAGGAACSGTTADAGLEAFPESSRRDQKIFLTSRSSREYWAQCFIS
ncbi:hypothetical protein P7K49_015494 [Saguinus oedipus]|uniref:Uncharacterized protein n=1 Tax=Saguinus oedipus TaxID=9490 RepID=A0ABQ9V9F2_SAGOE|nr:hypothetical protein P7K49_015494 [Saguinus oedipus]